MAAFDVSDHGAVVEGIAGIERDVGPIDILVNNAGIQRRAPLEDFEVETWHEMMRTNVDSVFYRRAGGGAAHDPARPGQDHQYRQPA